MSAGQASAHSPFTRWQLLHDTLVAATIASVLLLCETLHITDWLDAAMLRIAAPVAGNAAPSSALPKVVTIDAEAYAQTFQLRSPLPREPLVALLERIAAGKPSALLVDLQLEPAVGETANRPLDAALIDMAQRMRLVLPIPEVRTNDLDRQSLQWMQRLCDRGVRFASADLLTHIGAVVRYQPSEWALAGQVQSGDSVVCGEAKKAPTLQQLAWTVEAQGKRRHSLKVVSPSALRELVDKSIVSEALAGPMAPAFSNEIVVFGGSYESKDRLATLGGTVHGVYVHAAIIAGGLGESHLGGWALDIVFGTSLGLLFAALWYGEHTLREAAQARLSRHDQRIAWMLGFYLWLLCALLIWSVPLALGYLMVFASAQLVSLGWWLNPGPLIVGMFLHAFFVQHATHHAVTGLGDFLRRHPGAVLIQPAFIALVLFFYHHSHALEH